MSFIMANKKFTDNNTLDSSQVYDTGTNATMNFIAKRGLFGQGSGGDLNNCLSSGVYSFVPDTKNLPYQNQYIYGAVLVIVSDGWTHNNNNNWIWQIAFTTNNTIYTRQKINDSNWSSWKQII